MTTTPPRKRQGRVLENLQTLRQVQGRAKRNHERQNPRYMGRGHACTLVIAIGSSHRNRQTSVEGRQHPICHYGDIFPAGSTDFHRRAIVAVQRFMPAPVGGRYGDDPSAVGWLVAVCVEIETIVARGRDNNPPHVIHRVNRILVGRTAHARPAQAQIQHLRRVGIGRDTCNC